MTVPPSPERTCLTAERHPRPAPDAVGPDRAGEGRGRRTQRRRCGGQGPSSPGHCVQHLGRRPQGEADLRRRVTDAVPGAVGDQVESRWLGLRLPDLPVGRLGALPEHQRHHVGGSDAVDHAVMDLGEERPALVLEALDHPDLPERLGAVQVLGEDPRGGGAQLLLCARRGHGAVAQVVAEVEVGIVDPDRARPCPAGRTALSGDSAESGEASPRPSPAAPGRAAAGPRRGSRRRCASG